MVNPLALQIRAKKLGVLLRDARLAAGKNINECANVIGVSNAALSAYERGAKSPSLPELEVLAYYLDVPLDHFWGQDSRSESSEQKAETTSFERLIPLRQRIVGLKVRQAREEANLSLKEVSASIGITPRRLKTYETGEQPIPLPELEGIASAFNLPIREFFDSAGPVGRWMLQQQHVVGFLKLPVELQQFVVKPVNQPYIELAKRLSEMSVDKLRSVAEGLLDITL